MKTPTRYWFLSNFSNGIGGINFEEAANFCCVSPRTVRHWWQHGCPPWIDRMAEISKRMIPETKEWRGFSFSHDGSRLLTPYSNQSYSPSDLLRHFYEKQFSALTRVERDKLAEQLAAVRSDEEAEAIRTELDYIAKTLEKLKDSPILAPAGRFNQVVKK
ncbi:hypothetical protein [Shewanella dokdonensis]|uniref:DNA-binding protein n=2 Tax=Shewanella dokdonensis TaxID=712036 RepID=A0ABX8DJN3_9GAMM|nr:hypothetical protein [Shewanella dokdonensis]MCL1072985.1 hypothetical protein [Shewanella dokdonensis]QVK24940.1 hypothetical protein KHX94_18715 [Shewanella dokdonensis]